MGSNITVDTNLINLILWIPFAFVGLLAFLIYGIQGLRKGVKPALVSLAAIFPAALLGILIARGLGGVIAPILVDKLPAEFFGSAGFTGILELLLLSLCSALTAMLLFMLLFLILTPVIAAIGKAILRKKSVSTTVTGGSRAGGAALGLVSALLFALMFLLPLYGTLAAYIPTARTALDLILPEDTAPAKQETYTLQPLSATTRPLDTTSNTSPYNDLLALRDILDCMMQHPLVEVASSAPVQSVYSSMTQVSVEEAPVNIVDLAGTMETLMEKVSAVMQAKNGQQAAACRDLVAFLREHVLMNDWAYTVYMTAMEQIPELPLGDEPIAQAVSEELRNILLFDEDDFRVNMNAILDFAEAALEQDVLDALEKEDYAALAKTGLLTDACTLLNATEQMTEVKNLLYRAALETLAGDNAEQAHAFAEQYPLAQLTNPAQQTQEIEAFRCLMDPSGGASPADFLLRHPSLGEKALLDLIPVLGITG